MALLEFYGQECSHCVTMTPLVEKMEKELGITVEKHETWHNKANAALVKKYDTGLCGGVPFFFNTDSQKYICGEVSYEELTNWAKGN